jgi:RNA polymerase sigma-70 factor (ECF subfamily)
MKQTPNTVEGIGISVPELVAGARSGSGEAFAALVEPHLSRALTAATLIVGSPQDGADVVQDALESAWRGLSRLRDPQAFGAWFRRHVVRAALRTTRRRRNTVPLGETLVDPIDRIEQGLADRHLARAFSALPSADRLVLTLRYHWGLPTSEAAAILAIPEGTVKSRLHNAIARLRAEYDAQERM